MKIAIAFWNNRISPVFDVCRKYMIVDIQAGKVLSKAIKAFDNQDVDDKVNVLKSDGITLLICGAISRQYTDILSRQNIQIISFISGDVDQVIDAYIKGTLYEGQFLMPGCYRHQKRHKKRQFDLNG